MDKPILVTALGIAAFFSGANPSALQAEHRACGYGYSIGNRVQYAAHPPRATYYRPRVYASYRPSFYISPYYRTYSFYSPRLSIGIGVGHVGGHYYPSYGGYHFGHYGVGHYGGHHYGGHHYGGHHYGGGHYGGGHYGHYGVHHFGHGGYHHGGGHHHGHH